MNLDEKMVYISGFAWKHNIKKFPYTMCRKIDVKQSIKELEELLERREDNEIGWREFWIKYKKIFGEGLI